MKYGISKTTGLSFEEAVTKVTEELKKEGFGILTTIDIKETLKNKLDVDMEKYVILGACSPNFAYEALQAEQELGLLLPCNTIVYEKGGKTHVSIMNPELMASVTGNERLASVSKQVREVLTRAIERV